MSEELTVEQQLENLQVEHDKLKQKYKNSQDENVKLQRQIKSANSKADTAEDKLSKVEEDTERKYKRELATVNKDLEDSKQEVEAQKQAIEQMNQYLAALEQSLNTYMNAYHNTLKSIKGTLDNGIQLESILQQNFRGDK